MLPKMIEALEEWKWPYKIHSSLVDMQLVVNNQPILFRSGEAPERIRGFDVGSIWVDEAAVIREDENPVRDAWQQIPGRLRHKRAKLMQVLLTTTPEGTGTFVNRKFFEDPDPSHRIYIGLTAKNSFNHPDYIMNLRKQVGSDLQAQYLEGTAVDFAAGTAHPEFGRDNIQSIKLENASFHIGCDFNVSPMIWVLIAKSQGHFHVLDEAVIEDNAKVAAMVRFVNQQGWAKDRILSIHIDRSAKARRTTGLPEVDELEKVAKHLGWKYSIDKFGANPPVDERIKLVNRLIRNADGDVNLTVDPKCSTLLEHFKRARADEKGRYSKKAFDPHALDALGYAIWDCAARPKKQMKILRPNYPR